MAAETFTGEETAAVWRELCADIIVLDHQMPGFSGLEVAQRILAEAPGERVVVFTAHRDEETVRRAEQLGVQACVDEADLGNVGSRLLRLLHGTPQPEVRFEMTEVDLTA